MQNHSSSKSGSFRADINGLRAWAVVAVVLYHFGIPGFSGGFVGVDVFFVISGYLMTRIIVSGLSEGRFSLLQFYAARARRIVPALAALCLVLLAVGWHILPSADYKQLGEHAASSLAFVSNVVFSNEAGYFDSESHEKWLLHTWSLSVEWQFYLALPLVLLGLWRLLPNKPKITWCMAIALGASFALSVALAVVRPSSAAAFYLLPTRAWEMLAGGMVYLLATRRPSTGKGALLELLGIGLIVLSITLLNEDMNWPGAWALLPVAGAVAVLLAAREQSWLTGTWIAQSIGNASYSIYLWHWPMVVALGYFGLRQKAAVLTGLGLAMALGYLSYLAIESPSRKLLGQVRANGVLAGVGAGTAAVLAFAVVVSLNGGFNHRLPGLELIAGEATNRNPRIEDCRARRDGSSPSCLYGGDEVGAIVLGDSHAISVVTAVEEAFSSTALGVMEWSNGGCPSIFGAERHPPGPQIPCDAFNRWALERLAEVPPHVPVIIVNRNDYYVFGPNEKRRPPRPLIRFGEPYPAPTKEFLAEYAEHLVDSVCAFAEGRDVYLMRPIPEMRVNVPRVMLQAALRGNQTRVSITVDEYQARHAVTLAAQDEASRRCGAKILDPLPYLCEDGQCWGDRNGRPLYFDDDHLSEYGNRLLVPMFAAVAQKAAAQPMGAPLMTQSVARRSATPPDKSARPQGRSVP